ncbi:recombinase family protein, partial [Enterobacter roggenkampii]
GTVCVVGKMRDLILQLSKSSIYSTKPIVHQLGTTDLTSAAGKLLLSMLAAVAEMERDLLIERTQAGLSRAKAEGKKLGRPSKIAPEARRAIIEKKSSGISVSALAREYGVSRATIAALL